MPHLNETLQRTAASVQSTNRKKKSMAHNIQQRDIQTGIKMAWHERTNIVESINRDNIGIIYDMGIAQCNFTNDNGTQIKANGWQIYSKDDGLPIGQIVGDKYKLITNDEILGAVEKGLAGTKHKIVSAGTVANRSLGYISIKVLDDIIAAGRKTEPVVNIIWGHGGNRAVSYRTGMTVIVCQNTYNIAMLSSQRMSVKHTKHADIGDIAKEIDNHIGVTFEFTTEMNRLASIECPWTSARQLFAAFLTEKPEDIKATTPFKLHKKMQRLTYLYKFGFGNKGETMADAFNAVTDFYTHESAGRKATSWRQHVTSEFGTSSERKQKFFGMLSNDSRRAEALSKGAAILTIID